MPPEVIQYLLTDREFLYAGSGRAPRYQLPARAKFVQKDGCWVVASANAATFDAQRPLVYTTASEWLYLTLSRFLTNQGRATPLEAFCTVYANCTPTAVVPREALLDWLVPHCEIPAQSRWAQLCGPGPMLSSETDGLFTVPFARSSLVIKPWLVGAPGQQQRGSEAKSLRAWTLHSRADRTHPLLGTGEKAVF